MGIRQIKKWPDFEQFNHLEIDIQDALLLITIHRPKVLNALNQALLEELHQLFDVLADDPNVGAVIIKGAGDKAFVAGADIAEMVDMGVEEAQAFSSFGHQLGDKMANAPFPIIAAVQGYALGGGCELALACDFIYASEDAAFGFPEVKLGVIPGFGGTQRLSRRIGVGRALEFVMSGNMIKAEQALAMGLVNRIMSAEALLPAAIKTAQTIASRGPLAVAKAKALIAQGAEMPLPQANALEAKAFGELFATNDRAEGMKAFLEGRKADFLGQ